MEINLTMDHMLKEIEDARRHMIELAYDNPLNSEAVIKASRKLDKLLYEYQIEDTK